MPRSQKIILAIVSLVFFSAVGLLWLVDWLLPIELPWWVGLAVGTGSAFGSLMWLTLHWYPKTHDRIIYAEASALGDGPVSVYRRVAEKNHLRKLNRFERWALKKEIEVFSLIRKRIGEETTRALLRKQDKK